ncbi:MAG: hypothetical protein IKD72_01505, partial [Clostridia bacterium]|nr:hypothetical protein [Clostridia bacterium]
MKRLISLLLSASMLVTGAAVSAFAQTGACSCGHDPVIVLPGINHSPTYLYDENNEPVLDKNGDQVGGTLLILETDQLLKKCLPKLIIRLLATIAVQYPVGLESAAYEAACSAFRLQHCDEDGVHVENLQTKRWNHPLSGMTEDELDWVYRMVPMKPLVDEIGADHTYFFTFNLVGNPMDSAADLDAYIDMVRAQTGHDKVVLLPVSLGGTILTAYLDAYGHDKVSQICNAVACLDGTDIIADMMERKWNLADEFLYHEFIAQIFLDENGDASLGYLINSLLHILPRKGVDAILTGAWSGILDTMILNCPQFWAMLPSARYEALAARYLDDQPVLRAKTDRFQQARLNLKQNIQAAAEDGVRINFIAGANLDFGAQMYSYFGIVESAKKVNSDGIINLSSTTLGATGVPGGEMLPPGYTQKYTNPDDPDYSYLSPDWKVDASTAVLPDNTWIFLNQHHEVGNNDYVLNLAKVLILGEVEDVHSDPDNYPQFNNGCTTKYLRRWRIPDAEALLE